MMKIDITLKITPKMVKDAEGNEKKAPVGHLGTHFDVMDQEFPLDYTERNMLVFDVSKVGEREIGISDIEPNRIEAGMFVAFYTAFIEQEAYGTQRYYKEHPQLSNELIHLLLEKKVSIIGVDCAGIRRGKEHVPIDQYCAERGVFVIENLCNLDKVMAAEGEPVAHTYPINYIDVTGLPCRVIAEV